MLEIIERHTELAVCTVLILAVATCYLVRILSGQWRAVRQAELDSVLKEQMIQRGMSAQEIVAVLECGQSPVELPPEREFRSRSPRFSRPNSFDPRVLWLILGVPLVIVLLCGGLLFTMASVAVVSDESNPARVVDAPAFEDGR